MEAAAPVAAARCLIPETCHPYPRPH